MEPRVLKVLKVLKFDSGKAAEGGGIALSGDGGLNAAFSGIPYALCTSPLCDQNPVCRWLPHGGLIRARQAPAPPCFREYSIQAHSSRTAVSG